MKRKIKYLNIVLSIIIGILFLKLPVVKAENLYSKYNKPEFYGLIKAIIQKGDTFSLEDTKYRIFARDFEDGDLTNKIIVTFNNVDTTKAGIYKIKYEVSDSNNNKTTLEVIIEVINNQSKGRYYERKLYSLPSVENMTLAGTNRGNNHDRQMLGLYMEQNSKISVKKISGDKNLTLTYLNNDTKTEKNYTITNEYVDIISNNDGVPFIKTIYETKEQVIIGIKENDVKVHSLPYYHYKDDENKFFSNWNNLANSYAVIENEDITILVPYYDKNKIVNYYQNCFKSLDSFLLYWNKVINEYDEYLGLSYNPIDPIDQNVKTKYFVKANKNGAGSAYYAWDHVGINSNSVASFFEVNWGGLHEIGHGYQGSLKNDLDQGEVSNNILGYYVQTNRNITPYSLNWLGEISTIEENYQRTRLFGNGYYDLNVSGKLYFIINLLNYKNSKQTYAEINKIWRRSLKNNEYISTIDAYVLAYYNLYNINVIPYFNAWNLDTSTEIKEKVSSASIPSILGDIALNKTNNLKRELKKEGKYSLVSNEELKKFSLTGNLKITLNIDDIEQIKTKKIILKNETIEKELEIENNTISLQNMPIGTYQIILPVPKNNIYEYEKIRYITISNNKTNNINLKYIKENQMDLTNDLKIGLKGLGDWIFSEITFTNKKIKININAGTPHSYFNEKYAKIEIYDLNNQIVYSKEFIGNNTYLKEQGEINYEYGYKIVIYHKEATGRLILKSQLLNQEEKKLTKVSNQDNTYIIGKYGLYQNEKKSYQDYQEKIEKYYSKLNKKLTKTEIQNKNLSPEKKRKLLISVLKLNEKEKNEYLNKYNIFINGSSPVLNKQKIEIKQNENLNIYNILKGIDIEDGTYTLTKTNFKITYDLNNINNLGEYQIPYELKDNDDNITKGIIKLKIVQKQNNQSYKIEEEQIITPIEDNKELETKELKQEQENKTPSSTIEKVNDTTTKINSEKQETQKNNTSSTKEIKPKKNTTLKNKNILKHVITIIIIVNITIIIVMLLKKFNNK